MQKKDKQGNYDRNKKNIQEEEPEILSIIKTMI